MPSVPSAGPGLWPGSPDCGKTRRPSGCQCAERGPRSESPVALRVALAKSDFFLLSPTLDSEVLIPGPPFFLENNAGNIRVANGRIQKHKSRGENLDFSSC
jgi:hypothetical protein